MKYTCKNSPGQDTVEVELNNIQLLIRQRGKNRVIPYSSITDVGLQRNGAFYFITIQSLDFGSVRLSNRFYTEKDQTIDQSRQYHTFVRVFHLHLLKAQSNADFSSGFKPTRMTTKFITLILLSAFVYFTGEYLLDLPLNNLVASLTTLGLGVFLILAPYLTNPPKSYVPNDIPLNMLPPAS